MKNRIINLIVLVLGCLVLSQVAQAGVSVFATGLNNPRGLKFGPDGNLYVAEGGGWRGELYRRLLRTGDSSGWAIHR